MRQKVCFDSAVMISSGVAVGGCHQCCVRPRNHLDNTIIGNKKNAEIGMASANTRLTMACCRWRTKTWISAAKVKMGTQSINAPKHQFMKNIWDYLLYKQLDYVRIKA